VVVNKATANSKRKQRINAADEECSSPTTNATDEESSSPDRILIGQTPRGALRSRHMLQTAALFDKILNENPDRAKKRKEIVTVYKEKGCPFNDLRIADRMQSVQGDNDPHPSIHFQEIIPS
jgi:hypothetical protein